MWRFLLLLVVALQPINAALAGPREVREPPHWTGVLDPLARACPYSFAKGENHGWIAICKTAIAGNVVNTKPFSPWAFEDKNDEDWNFLKKYWNSKQNFYFAATGCSSSDNESGAKAGAQQTSLVNVLRLMMKPPPN